MKLEIHQLDRYLADLKIASPSRHRQLVASLLGEGQQSPATVVPAEQEGRYVLVDGHARVRALEELGRDHVEVLVWPLSVSEALVLCHKSSRRRPTALEDGWLLMELVAEAGWSRAELCLRFERSASWVSRRLGLVTALPSTVQEAVRHGQVSAHAAMKSLLPLARAHAAACEDLVANLEGEHLSVRDAEKLHAAWRRADGEGRARIVTRPRLCLDVLGETAPATAEDEPLLCDARVLERVSSRLEGRLLREGAIGALEGLARERLAAAVKAAATTLDRVTSHLHAERGTHARLRDADRDSSIAP